MAGLYSQLSLSKTDTGGTGAISLSLRDARLIAGELKKFRYSEMTEEYRAGPTSGVRLTEVSVKRELTVVSENQNKQV